MLETIKLAGTLNRYNTVASQRDELAAAMRSFDKAIATLTGNGGLDIYHRDYVQVAVTGSSARAAVARISRSDQANPPQIRGER